MRIEQKYVDIAIEHTEKESREHSVVFGGKDIEEFKRTLKGIAEVSKYTEGQEMSKEDIATIARARMILRVHRVVDKSSRLVYN